MEALTCQPFWRLVRFIACVSCEVSTGHLSKSPKFESTLGTACTNLLCDCNGDGQASPHTVVRQIYWCWHSLPSRVRHIGIAASYTSVSIAMLPMQLHQWKGRGHCRRRTLKSAHEMSGRTTRTRARMKSEQDTRLGAVGCFRAFRRSPEQELLHMTPWALCHLSKTSSQCSAAGACCMLWQWSSGHTCRR
eukprot:4209870-Amphidinium_carterae.1